MCAVYIAMLWTGKKFVQENGTVVGYSSRTKRQMPLNPIALQPIVSTDFHDAAVNPIKTRLSPFRLLIPAMLLPAIIHDIIRTGQCLWLKVLF